MSAKEYDLAPRTFVPKPTPKSASITPSIQSSLEFINNIDEVLRTAGNIQRQVIDILPYEVKNSFPISSTDYKSYKEVAEAVSKQLRWLLDNDMIGTH